MRKPFIPFHVPDIGEAEVRAVAKVLRSGWLTTGPKAREFEARMCRYVGARHAVAVNSCTAALHLALESLGIRQGDEVLVPAMTFAATAEVVLYLKARPVLVDCDPDTLNISPDDMAAKATSKTRAVIPVHFGGHACDMDRVLGLSRARGIKVVEDAAHALPSAWDGRMVGGIGDVTCFSFYATKTITTGEGGMAVTDREDLAERMRLMSLHGISKDAWKRYTARGSWYYEIIEPGYKYNMTDVAAALGVEQLKRCDAFWRGRDRIARFYDKALAGVPGLRLPVRRPRARHAWHLYVVQLELERLTIDRARFIELMRQAGVGTSVHFIPLHLHPFYRNSLGTRPEDFPSATAVYERTVSLPIYSRLSGRDAERVAETVRAILRRHKR